MPASLANRPPDLRIARLHVRTGVLALARTELETAAGTGSLDVAGLLDLAEVRWRTGDITGAGEAASAFLASSVSEGRDLAEVIAAEAAAAAGHADEAARLVAQALDHSGPELDRIFAGMPSRAAWPPHALRPVVSSDLEVSAGAAATTGSTMPVGGPGLWDEAALLTGPAAPDAHAVLEAGRAAMRAGQVDLAALHLSVALRLSAALAPAVLEVAGDEATGPAMAVVRGDALRAVGYEWEAHRAFTAAAVALAAPAPATPASSGQHAARTSARGNRAAAVRSAANAGPALTAAGVRSAAGTDGARARKHSEADAPAADAPVAAAPAADAPAADALAADLPAADAVDSGAASQRAGDA